jgi:hypothetical protein
MKYLRLINDHHFMTITTLAIGYVIVWIKIIINFLLQIRVKLQV